MMTKLPSKVFELFIHFLEVCDEEEAQYLCGKLGDLIVHNIVSRHAKISEVSGSLLPRMRELAVVVAKDAYSEEDASDYADLKIVTAMNPYLQKYAALLEETE